MTKKRSAKNAFISSLVMLCLCVTMLVGTTFAWYTDSVTSGRNTIVAGSLDMTVTVRTVDNNQQVTWETVDATTPVFPDNLSFEPGAVHVAYIKVTNTGDLAFKYNVKAVVDNEIQGTNHDNQKFSLSSYLKFKAVPVDDVFGSRAEALTALGDNPPALTSASITDDGVYLAAGDPDPFVMLALIIYMPEDVGNIANPLPGDANKPKITFGIDAIATQYVSENDSFSNTYDASATMPATAQKAVETTGATTITAGAVTVQVPAGSDNASTSDTLYLDVNNVNNNDTTGVLSMNIDLVNQNGDKVTNSTNPMTVAINVGPGKVLTSVKHNGNDVANYTYDDATGILTFETASFSPFAITYIVGKGVSNVTEWNEALADASVDTIVLLADISLTSANTLNRNLTLNLNGKALTSSAVLFNIYANCDLTIKDSVGTGTITVNANRIVYSSGGGLVKLEGGNLSLISTDNYGYGVLVGSGSSFEMTGGSITIPNETTSTYSYCVCNSGSGTVTIAGGELIAKSFGGNYTISASGSGNLYITGGHITGIYGKDNWGLASTPYVIYNTGSGTAYISGGYIRAVGNKNDAAAGHLVEGNASITGGYFGGVYFYSLSSDQIAQGYASNLNDDSSTSADYKYVVLPQ
ncbi:MAG: hypothetical protein J5756_07535 [Clostridia bacterium]|nr:hypothetical protein [Clostridia bacterium]